MISSSVVTDYMAVCRYSAGGWVDVFLNYFRAFGMKTLIYS